MTHDFLRPYGGGGSGGGWTNRGTALERLEPHLADSAYVQTAAGAWAWGAYVTLQASTPADYYPSMVHMLWRAQSQISGLVYMRSELEIATGPAGAEVPFAIVPWSLGYFVPTGEPLAITGLSYPVGPTLIPSGTRIAARIRKNFADTTIIVDGDVYLSGHQAPVPASDTTYALDAHLGGASTPHTITIPSGGAQTITHANYPAYGAWTSILDPAPNDLLVWGAAAINPVAVGTRGAHLQFGTGPSGGGSEVARAVLGFPNAGGFTLGAYWLRRPMLVLSGERWSARAAGDSNNYAFFYEEL